MLPSLHIKNFRCLEDFQVSRLGRVNLIVGKNNSGKSSVLEALRIYAGKGQREVLAQVIEERDGVKSASGLSAYADAEALSIFGEFFTGYMPPSIDVAITIGSMLGNRAETLCIQCAWEKAPLASLQKQPCAFVSTRFVAINELAKLWDDIVFTEAEEVVKDFLRFIASDFQALTFVENQRGSGRIAKVKLANLPHPVSLNSLGDGMVRVLQLALKIFPAKGGFLLIDEFENGLHYSVQEKVWAKLFAVAKELDIQIFATTHSWDCIESFANVACQQTDNDGILFRVGRSVKKSDAGKVIATVFDGAALSQLTQADVEVR